LVLSNIYQSICISISYTKTALNAIVSFTQNITLGMLLEHFSRAETFINEEEIPFNVYMFEV